MLSQRLVKEACLLDVVADREAQNERLQETIALFDASLAALQVGMPDAGIMPPPNSDVAERLAWVGQLWSGLRDDLQLSLARGPLDGAALNGLSQRAELVLSEMSEAVRLYGG
jgi:hypothetical protein